MNLITIEFIECNEQPAKGYHLFWRVAGSGDPLTDAGHFFTSPAVFYDSLNPAGALYEGVIRSELRNTVCTDVIWGTNESGSSGASGPNNLNIDLVSPCTPGNPLSSYLISGANPGDVIVVEANYTGVIQRLSGLFTRADLAISSPDDSSGTISSTCYTDVSMHGFTITASCFINIIGTSGIINLTAVVHNSSDSIAFASIKIVSQNGNPRDITIVACDGNSGTGGTC